MSVPPPLPTGSGSAGRQPATAAGALAGKRVLVTGAGGYLGSTLVPQLRDAGCRVTALDRSDGEPAGGTDPAGVVRVYGDICDPEIWEHSLEGVEAVFHLAAQTSAQAANQDPVADQALNVMPMLHLLEACRRGRSRPAVVFASTVTVAGLPQRLPVDETHPDHPLTAYDLHKQIAEQYLRWYSEQGFVRGVALRLANVYGPGPLSSRADRGVLNRMMRRALDGQALTVYGAGNQIRDYVYVEDVARALVSAAEHAEALSGAFFVIGSGLGHSIREAMELIAARVLTRTGRKVEVRQVEPPAPLSPIEERSFVADPGRFCRATGWQPRITLSEGIDLSLEAFS